MEFYMSSIWSGIVASLRPFPMLAHVTGMWMSLLVVCYPFTRWLPRAFRCCRSLLFWDKCSCLLGLAFRKYPHLLFIFSRCFPSFCRELMIVLTLQLYFYFFYLKWGSDNRLIVALQNDLQGRPHYCMFSDVPSSYKDWREQFVFVDANLFPGYVGAWHPREDDSYHVDMPDLTLAERVNVHRIFNSINVSIPLKCVTNLFDLEGMVFLFLLFYIGCLVTLFTLCIFLLEEPLWAFYPPLPRPVGQSCVWGFTMTLAITREAWD